MALGPFHADQRIGPGGGAGATGGDGCRSLGPSPTGTAELATDG